MSNQEGVQTISSYFLRKVPEQTVGRVHSVFQTSFNVETDALLVHIGTGASPLSCLGFHITSQRMQELLPRIRPGDRAVFRGGLMRIYDVEGVSTIPYGENSPVALEIEPSDRIPGPALQRALQRMGLRDRVGIPWDAALEQALAVLREPKAEQERLCAAVGFLLGRGKGLTPSGDDILMGYGTGLQTWGDPEPLRQALRAVLKRQTTDISIAYLGAMLDGCVNEDYKHLLDAVRAGQEETYDVLLEQISRHGHTSGCDSLLGLLTAVEALR